MLTLKHAQSRYVSMIWAFILPKKVNIGLIWGSFSISFGVYLMILSSSVTNLLPQNFEFSFESANVHFIFISLNLHDHIS